MDEAKASRGGSGTWFVLVVGFASTTRWSRKLNLLSVFGSGALWEGFFGLQVCLTEFGAAQGASGCEVSAHIVPDGVIAGPGAVDIRVSGPEVGSSAEFDVDCGDGLAAAVALVPAHAVSLRGSLSTTQ